MYVERDAPFEKLARLTPALAIIGPRQSGKTTLLKRHMRGKYAYIPFDDPEEVELFANVKRFMTQHPEQLLIIDEVQYAPDAGRRVKYMVDQDRRVWITGSASIDEVLGALAGRVTILKLYPFSFAEFTRAKREKAPSAAGVQRLVWEHMVFGGYPRVVFSQEKKQLLKDLVETIIMKDVVRTFRLKDIMLLRRLIHHLALLAGKQLEYDNLATTLGTTFLTLREYLDILEATHVIQRVRPFFTNKQKELVKQPKLYFLDTGLRNGVLNSFPSVPDGHLFENYIFTELVKQGFAIKYWRSKSKAEVDFILDDAVPVEVKLTRPMISKSLRSFIKTYRPPVALIISQNVSQNGGEPLRLGTTVVELLQANEIERVRKVLSRYMPQRYDGV